MKPIHIFGIAAAVGLGLIGLVVFTKGARPGRGELLPGGRASGRRPEEFDPTELRVGTLIEMEHTGNPYVAQEIAMDHLAEDARYYTGLCKLHKDEPCKLLV